MTIKQWLENPANYDTGVALYNAAFGEGKWERMYRGYMAKALLHKKLIYWLKRAEVKYAGVSIAGGKVVNESPIIPEPKQSAPPPQHVFTAKPTVYPETRLGKEMEAKDLYRMVGRLRADLFSEEKAIREKAALAIKANMKKNRSIWEEINYFDKYGVWPAKQDDSFEVNLSTASISDLIAMKQNLAPWCSKEKKKIAIESDEEKKKIRIATLTAKLQQLDLINAKLQQL